jgi:hypothetical protein
VLPSVRCCCRRPSYCVEYLSWPHFYTSTSMTGSRLNVWISSFLSSSMLEILTDHRWLLELLVVIICAKEIRRQCAPDWKWMQFPVPTHLGRCISRTSNVLQSYRSGRSMRRIVMANLARRWIKEWRCLIEFRGLVTVLESERIEIERCCNGKFYRRVHAAAQDPGRFLMLFITAGREVSHVHGRWTYVYLQIGGGSPQSDPTHESTSSS